MATTVETTAPVQITDTTLPAAALLEGTTLEPLRDFQYKDASGNAIGTFPCSHLYCRLTAEMLTSPAAAEPDLANPTRPRWERPLDTIRSFEKAIDSGYKRRSSIIRSGEFSAALDIEKFQYMNANMGREQDLIHHYRIVRSEQPIRKPEEQLLWWW